MGTTPQAHQRQTPYLQSQDNHTVPWGEAKHQSLAVQRELSLLRAYSVHIHP